MLDEIVAYKKRKLHGIDKISEIKKIEDKCADLNATKSLKRNIISEYDISIITEIKRKSPSKGILNTNVDVQQFASSYENAGAVGISVLTEDKYFGGSIDDLIKTKEITSLPVLRKDFIIDEFQIWQSRAIGADVILLIAAILNPERLLQFRKLANSLGMEVIIEIHSQNELERALKASPDIIGINNRNLSTFAVDLSTFTTLRSFIPDDIVCIAESGIHTRKDMLYARNHGADAVLIGESIISSDDPFKKIQYLRGVIQ